MKRTFLIIRNQTIYIIIVVLFFVIIASGYSSTNVVTNDISSVRSVKALHLVSKYKKETATVKEVNTFDEIVANGKESPVKTVGIMTGYSGYCVGCGGRTGCPPRQDVRNGNIYFDDKEYGKINIVATDKKIPCGSIIEITDSTLGEKVVAIALDRGGAINGSRLDFLVKSEEEASRKIGKQKVTYQIVRWGW